MSWKCVEDYDEDLDIFHFVPALSEDDLAEGVELPVLTVNVLGRIEGPTMPLMEAEQELFLGSTEVYFAPEGTALPASYNNYENGSLPPVRSQGNYGTCWAFATIAAAEADLMSLTPASTFQSCIWPTSTTTFFTMRRAATSATTSCSTALTTSKPAEPLSTQPWIWPI